MSSKPWRKTIEFLYLKKKKKKIGPFDRVVFIFSGMYAYFTTREMFSKMAVIFSSNREKKKVGETKEE